MKKRIRELCGLDTLSKEKRIERCHQLIDDVPFKHSLCNRILGVTFKDIEKVLRDEINDKKPLTHEQKVFKVLSEQVPEKMDPDILKERKRDICSIIGAPPTMEEVNQLLNAPDITVVEEPLREVDFSKRATYSLEEVTSLIDGKYDPRNFPKKPYRSE